MIGTPSTCLNWVQPVLHSFREKMVDELERQPTKAAASGRVRITMGAQGRIDMSPFMQVVSKLSVAPLRSASMLVCFAVALRIVRCTLDSPRSTPPTTTTVTVTAKGQYADTR